MEQFQTNLENWEAIKAHFLWTCCNIPDLEENSKDHPDTDWGDNLDEDLPPTLYHWGKLTPWTPMHGQKTPMNLPSLLGTAVYKEAAGSGTPKGPLRVTGTPPWTSMNGYFTKKNQLPPSAPGTRSSSPPRPRDSTRTKGTFAGGQARLPIHNLKKTPSFSWNCDLAALPWRRHPPYCRATSLPLSRSSSSYKSRMTYQSKAQLQAEADRHFPLAPP